MRMTIPNDTVALRAAAARVVERLALDGFNNASIEKVDAWVGSPEFNGDETGAEAGAYLGEAIIKRHGGKWIFPDGDAPQVRIERNGIHFINPFGKVAKRVANGQEDHLISLVKLAEHVTTETKLDANKVVADAHEALRLLPPDGVQVSVGGLLAAVTLVPLVVFIGLLVMLGLQGLLWAAIGGVLGIPLGLVLLRLVSKGPKRTRHMPGTLGFEAQLTMDPLAKRLAEKLRALGERPSRQQLDEVAFYAAQMRKLHAIVESGDPRPGRGYVGYDTYGKETSSWPD